MFTQTLRIVVDETPKRGSEIYPNLRLGTRVARLRTAAPWSAPTAPVPARPPLGCWYVLVFYQFQVWSVYFQHSA